MSGRAGTVVLAALLWTAAGGAAPAAAQDGLRAAADRFASVWSRGDGGGLGSLMAETGIRLELGDRGHGSLSPRLALASLSEFLASRRSVEAEVRKVSEVGGSPRRGFAEIAWDATAAGTSEPLRYTIFVGFVEESGGWQVSEIRVLR